MGLFWAALGAQKASVVQAVAAAGRGPVEGDEAKALKPWVWLSRVLYGIPSVAYADT